MRRISDYDDFYEAPIGLGGALELRDFGEEASSWGGKSGPARRGGAEYAQARPPTRRGLPARSPAQEVIADQIVRLEQAIRRFNPNEAFLNPPGGSHSPQTLQALQRRLDELQRATVYDRNTGWPVQRFIGDGLGNNMIEPLGGSTVPGKSPVDTHTRYPNGSNYQRLNPEGHGARKTPHGHGHLEGAGPGKSGQGASIDVWGNVVPYNSPDAHWSLRK
ncbi:MULTISPECIES: hypothetical protein [unclassified Ensifer]|uniref:hypothetical protein n=1 Tax=unclassified Ensifer TaxID=2633371 RepID=UPI000813284C|nr:MULTISPECIES: hypothetical protein [unclassified Ensifer]OCO98906.1 hypothetical protein BC362_27070 [Ensifer sp. LC14]OCP04439.1 hypothetical protein BBX50_25695 [Ensifer sp. LC11]OCP04720.1 hypothetical protein BC374_25715 [Ensifer sp. LC13]OCP30544.1 hypothetical protein BC364_25730 [Ensifer sp. LC499]